MLLAQLDGQSLLSGATAVGGYVGVKALQEQLRRIAFEFGKPSADPAVYDGTMTLGTMIALANAAPIIGDKIHSGVGQALDVIKLLKAPIEKLPYGSTIINFILSPWIVDKIFSVILSIIRLVPGGGGAATAMSNGVNAAKTAIANAASPIAAALLVVKKSNGFGDAMLTDVDWAHGSLGEEVRAGYCWIVATSTVPGHWERMRAGQTACANPPPPGASAPVVRDQRSCSAATPENCPGGVFVTDSSGNVVPVRVGLPPPSSTGGFPGIVRDHRSWPKGKEIVSADWGRTRTYDGIVPFENLSARDQKTWNANKNQGPFAFIPIPSSYPNASQLAELTVGRGAIAFLTFRGFDDARMGAFWDSKTHRLKIIAVPEPSSSKYPWDYVADAVSTVVDAVGDAAGAIGGAIADVAQSTWNWIAENADDVYNAIKKYGCAIVNNDIVVGIAAGAAGIVATPATSAAIVGGAQAGKAGCAALEVAEALYAIYQLLSMDLPKPPPLDAPTPPSPNLPIKFAIVSTQFFVPLTPPVVPLAKPRYPVGTIAAFDPKLHVYRVAIPVGTQLNVLSGLGAAASHFEVEVIDHAPPIVAVVPLTAYQKQTATLPVYKNPIFWIAVGTGAAALGGGGYALYRRRRRLTR